MLPCLAFLALTTSLFAQVQTTNLGGGCATPAMLNEGLTDNIGLIVSNQTSQYILVAPQVNSSSYIGLLAVGFSDPNALLPSCGCVLHTTGDILVSPTSFSPFGIAYVSFPAGYSANVTIQRVNLAYACNELSFGLCFSDAVDVYLP